MTQKDIPVLLNIESKIMSLAENIAGYQQDIVKLKKQYEKEKDTRLGVDIAYEISFRVSKIRDCEIELKEQQSLKAQYIKYI